MAAAAAIAEKPNRVYSLIENTSYPKSGLFRFKFWENGEWRHINIDDRLPTILKYDNSGHEKFYTTEPSRAGAHWFPLMEKAYAKMNQNYERIIAGDPAVALH